MTAIPDHEDEQAAVAFAEPLERITPDELADLFHFEPLSDEQLRFRADHAHVTL